jgi:hypothetical protein
MPPFDIGFATPGGERMPKPVTDLNATLLRGVLS